MIYSTNPYILLYRITAEILGYWTKLILILLFLEVDNIIDSTNMLANLNFPCTLITVKIYVNTDMTDMVIKPVSFGINPMFSRFVTFHTISTVLAIELEQHLWVGINLLSWGPYNKY